MFFIMGISQKEQDLNFGHPMVCKCCGKYGRVDVFMTYTYFMFFFIPIFKWNKRYYASMNCCGAISELSPAVGQEIEKGNLRELKPDELNFGNCENQGKHCRNCGFVTTEDFQFCPKCGRPL